MRARVGLSLAVGLAIALVKVPGTAASGATTAGRRARVLYGGGSHFVPWGEVSALLLLARLVLAAVLATAGLAKLADRAGSRRAVVDFVMPERLVAPVALLLPLTELVAAAALLPATTARAPV